jgi:F-type H+-transporting ATPase subunit epsilon
MADNDQLQVELVAADRTVWSGQATMVIARTTEGDVGVMRNHAPLLSLLVPGVVEIRAVEGDDQVAAVDGGFLSVANNRVSILSEHTVLSHDIDVEQARADLEAAESDHESDDAQERAKRAEARIRAVEKAS